MNNFRQSFLILSGILVFASSGSSYAQHYGNKFIIAPDNPANDFTIDRIAQEVYFDYYKGFPLKVNLKTMVVEPTNHVAPAFGNKLHLMLDADTSYNMDEGTQCSLPLPDSPAFLGSLTYSFPILFSPNDSNIMFSIRSLDTPHLVNGYVISLKDSSITPIDTSVNFTAESNGRLIPQWSSDTSFIYGISDSCLVEYFIGSRRIDTLVTLHNYSKMTSFAYNTTENILAYAASAWIAPNFDERIYFYYRNSLTDSLVFSLQNDCSSMADVLIWLSWSPDNERLGFLAYSSINKVTSIYFYSLDSSRVYRATQYCNDPDKKYYLTWANEETLVYFDAEDYHLYGMDISSMIDDIHENKNEPVATDFSLSSYPNPFNPTTTIRYQLSAVSNVTLKIYDLLGREVAVLIDKKELAGTHTVRWNASNLASGVYLCQMRAGRVVEVKKLMLMK